MVTEANSINAATTGIVGNTGTSFTGTAVTQYNMIVGGSSSSTLANVAPSATLGIPLISAGSSANPIFGTALVAGGGTGDTSFTAYSVVCGGTTSTAALQNVSGVGTTGQVLTSNGASALPTWKAVSADGAVTQINGNSGSATPSSGVITVSSGNSGSSVTFTASGSTDSLTVTDSNFNTIIGSGAGNGSISGQGNCGFGEFSLLSLTSGNNNCAAGYASLSSLQSGSQNSAFNQDSLQNLTTGSFNTCYGYFSGGNYNGAESSNLIIGLNLGVNGESHVTRIGVQGSGSGGQTKCFIAGIATVAQSTFTTPALTYLDTATGQLGAVVAAASSTATAAFGATLTAGTATQNTTGYGLLLNISVSITAATTATITMGVGTTSTPTTNTIDASFTTAAVLTKSFCAFVPNGYYVLVNTTGTITIGSITVQACAIG